MNAALRIGGEASAKVAAAGRLCPKDSAIRHPPSVIITCTLRIDTFMQGNLPRVDEAGGEG